jgi:hypothetical protein
VKRGVRQHLEMGSPLIAGRRYRLVVDAGWRDARGAALASGFEKEFVAGARDDSSPDPAEWRVTAPHAGTRDPIRVAFGEPLDHALAFRMIGVIHDGSPVDGQVELAAGDSVWRFVPARRWRAGRYQLRVDAALEDLAGNSVARVFDVDRRQGAPGAEESAHAGSTRTVEIHIRG